MMFFFKKKKIYVALVRNTHCEHGALKYGYTMQE